MGERFLFALCLKLIFLGTTKFVGHKKIKGALPPNALPWQRACDLAPGYAYVNMVNVTLARLTNILPLMSDLSAASPDVATTMLHESTLRCNA